MAGGFIGRRVFGILGDKDALDIYGKFGIKDISGRTVRIEDVVFAGFPGSLMYRGGITSFEQDDSLEYAGMIGDADILLSHAGAYNEEETDPTKQGLQGISSYIFEHHIPMHFHGHNMTRTRTRLANDCISRGIYKSEIVGV